MGEKRGLFFVFLCDTYVRGYIYGTSTVQCIMNIGETSRKKSFLGGKSRKKSFLGEKNRKKSFLGEKSCINIDCEQVLTHCINSDYEQCSYVFNSVLRRC